MAAKPANYFIIQCYVAFAEQPQTPIILRVDEDLLVNDVLLLALNKYNEIMKYGDVESEDRIYAPPSTNPNDYVLRCARGDGTPDRGAPPLSRSGAMKEQGLVFPYMLVLSLDPAKDLQSMDLTEAYKQKLLLAASQSAAANVDVEPESEDDHGPLIPPPADAPSTQSEQWRQHSSTLMQAKREELQKRRAESVKSIELDRKERERKHLEECTKKERERLLRLVEQRKEEEQRQLQLLEQNHKLQMAKKMEQSMRDQKQREMIEAQKLALEQEDRDRKRRQEALERERALRAEQRLEQERAARKEKISQWESGKASRIHETLEYVIAKLDYSIEVDTQLRHEMLERERLEREAYEREQFEREYVSKVHRMRRQQKEAETAARLNDQAKVVQQKLAADDHRHVKLSRTLDEEEQRRVKWMAQRAVEKEKVKCIAELSKLKQESLSLSTLCVT